MAGVHLVDASTSPDEEPDVACDLSGRQYVIAWQTRYTNLKYGIWGRLAYPDESMDPSFAIVEPSGAADRAAPVVAGGYTNYLVAWEHERAGTSYQDIHGRLITPHALFMPQVLRRR